MSQLITSKDTFSALAKILPNKDRIIKSSDFKNQEELSNFEAGLAELKKRGYQVSVSFGMGSVPFATYRISQPE